MSDISREEKKTVYVDDVLKLLHKYGKFVLVTDTPKYVDMEYKIANLPSADVRENVHGEWITHDTEHLGYFIECSNCNSAFGAYLPYKHFCPNCGADMRGKAE